MEFTMPTTKAELYEVLEEIETHYKGDLRLFTPPEFQTLTLSRMSYTPTTEEDRLARAEKLVEYGYEEALAAYLAELDAQIAKENGKKSARIAARDQTVLKLQEEYAAASEALRAEASRRGTLNSSAVANRLAALSEKRAAAIAEEEAACLADVAACDAAVAAYNQKKEDAPDAVLPPFESKRENALIELEKLDWERAAEVLKYNNQVEEKEVKYANALLSTVAKLRLEFIQAAAQGYSEDQLVAMGYYKDVIAAVLGYYDTLTPQAASEDFNNEQGLIVYLGSYYNNVSFLLSQRAAQAGTA